MQGSPRPLFRPVPFPLLALGYMLAWGGGFWGAVAVIMRLFSGESLREPLIVSVSGWLIILWIHRSAGWFPFKKKVAPGGDPPQA